MSAPPQQTVQVLEVPAQLDGRTEIRVLSVPSGHVYVRHLTALDGDDGVRRLPDPLVSPDLPASQWWPPPSLDATWVREHADEFDVFHVHFGFDARSPQQLADLVDALAAAGRPLVYTVHDLRNPHHLEPGLHDAHLDVLVPAAAALVTLTPGAAAEIRRRWGREAVVLPHPHVVELERLARPRPDHEGYVVGVHLKSVRASMDVRPVVDTLARVVPTLPGARLRLDVHTDVVTPGFPRHDAELAARLLDGQRAGELDLHVHDFFTDDELWDYFESLDLSVLPYRFGTHSGWLEACHDLGTAVAAPDCGFYAEQRPCLGFHLDEGGLDAASLEDAVRRAHAERPAWKADPTLRRTEREGLAAAHHAIYRRVTGARRG